MKISMMRPVSVVHPRGLAREGGALQPETATVAAVGGVKVLNPNALAEALRPGFATGETLSLQITKAGREPGQGLAYLDDGTMVVVEGAADRIGQRVSAAVTSYLQTQVGRMVFAQLES